MYIYKRVRDLREDRDLTQSDVAKLLKKQTTTYRRWETGQTEIPVHIIVKLCKTYNVSADYILGFTNEPKPLPKK